MTHAVTLYDIQRGLVHYGLTNFLRLVKPDPTERSMVVMLDDIDARVLGKANPDGTNKKNDCRESYFPLMQTVGNGILECGSMEQWHERVVISEI